MMAFHLAGEATTPRGDGGGGDTGTTYSERAIDVPGVPARPPTKKSQEEREAAAASTLAGVIREGRREKNSEMVVVKWEISQPTN